MRRLGGLAVVAALVAVACGPGDGARADGRLRVVATTGMIADLAAHVGGARVAVQALMGPGVDPHLYKASAGDVRRIGGADLLLYNGLHLEAAMAEVLREIAARRPSVAVAERVPRERLLTPPEYEGQPDPHVWFDVRLWLYALEAVADALAEVDPEGEPEYRASAASYATRLETLDSWVREQLARVPAERRVLVTAHDAFNYFGRAYDVEVRGLQGINTATEAGTADVQALAAYIAERRIPSIFVETSVPRRTIEAVREAVRARGFQVRIGDELYSDAMGDPGTPEGTYEGMIRHNVRAIVDGLGAVVDE
jgi:manganese/zinc/iron transport system substrate-binding protein